MVYRATWDHVEVILSVLTVEQQYEKIRVVA